MNEAECEALLICQIVINPNQLFPPVSRLNRGGYEYGVSATALSWKRNLAEKTLDGGIIRIEAGPCEVGAYAGAIPVRVNWGALIAKIPGSFLDRGHRLVEVLPRHSISAPLLRPEEEGVILPDRPANGVAIVILFIGRNRLLEVIACVKGIIPHKLVDIAV